MDIKTICIVASTVMSFCTFIGGAVAFCVIRFNDMVHIEKNFEKSQKQYESFKTAVNEKLDNLLTISNDNIKDIAVINTRLDRNKRLK